MYMQNFSSIDKKVSSVLSCLSRHINEAEMNEVGRGINVWEKTDEQGPCRVDAGGNRTATPTELKTISATGGTTCINFKMPPAALKKHIEKLSSENNLPFQCLSCFRDLAANLR